ncbi:MAG: hypothetical protein MUE63_14400 [Xanthomonadales bacterium]|nr:hypothetical protein [Xanthomonadales bacterium]
MCGSEAVPGRRRSRRGIGVARLAPHLPGERRRGRQGHQCPLGLRQVLGRCVALAQLDHALRQRAALRFQGPGQRVDPGVQFACPGGEQGARFGLLRVGGQRPLARVEVAQHLAVHRLRHRDSGDLPGHHHHRRQVGDDQHDVLGDLGPGDRPHAAEEGAHQDPGQADEHADLQRQADEAAGDDAHAVDLRHHVGEGHHDHAERADRARQVAAVARPEEVGNRVLAEPAQVGREEQGHQHEAAGPADDEGQPLVAAEVHRPRQADERGGAHPVGAGGHAVEERRHPAPRDVVLGDVGGAAEHADERVQRDRGDHEGVADVARRQAQALGQGHEQDERHEAAGVDRVIEAQAPVELRVGRGDHRSPSPQRIRRSSRAMTFA